MKLSLSKNLLFLAAAISGISCVINTPEAHAAKPRVKCPIVVDLNTNTYKTAKDNIICFADKASANRKGFLPHGTTITNPDPNPTLFNFTSNGDGVSKAFTLPAGTYNFTWKYPNATSILSLCRVDLRTESYGFNKTVAALYDGIEGTGKLFIEKSVKNVYFQAESCNEKVEVIVSRE